MPHHQAALKANSCHPVYRAFYRNHRQTLADILVALGDQAGVATTAVLKPPRVLLCQCLATHGSGMTGRQGVATWMPAKAKG